MNINVVPSVSMNKDNIYLPSNTPYIGLTIAAGLMSLVIPIFVCKYRFKGEVRIYLEKLLLIKENC